MSGNRMSLDEFTEITAPLYRQFAGFMPDHELAVHKVDRYEFLHRLQPEALRVAVTHFLATGARMPTISELERRAFEWTIAQRGDGGTPTAMSDQCPHCVATIGVYPSGRLGTRHESSCWYHNADVQPLTTVGEPATLREAIAALRALDQHQEAAHAEP